MDKCHHCGEDPVAPNTIDLDKNMWQSLVNAANQSTWIPPEYYMNDWVSDCARFLLTGEGLTHSPDVLRDKLARTAYAALTVANAAESGNTHHPEADIAGKWFDDHASDPLTGKAFRSKWELVAEAMMGVMQPRDNLADKVVFVSSEVTMIADKDAVDAYFEEKPFGDQFGCMIKVGRDPTEEETEAMPEIIWCKAY